MAYQREAEVVLARWREVERIIADLADGDDRLEALHFEASQLRDEYQALVHALEHEGGGGNLLSRSSVAPRSASTDA